MYGEELFAAIPVTGVTPIVLEASTGAIFQRAMAVPGTVLYWGYRPTVAFNYDTLVTKGILTLYRYTKKIQTAVLGNAAGAGYAVGDLLSVTQAGASGAILRVKTAPAGVVATVEIVNKGINYRAASNLATVALNGSGNNAFTVTISDKLALDTCALKDGSILGKQYMRRVPNVLGDESPSAAPPRAYCAGEELVIEITTQANGGTEVGDFDPILVWQNRAENFANQDLWVEATAS